MLNGKKAVEKDLVSFSVAELHQHSFTIPIEWEYFTKYQQDDFNRLVNGKESKRVTKLMCECGEAKTL